ncbi:MAG: TonB-dependent receptor [Methylococcaceae bacterium]|nr:TonB-dependent receptor [Methylococcaceae bacterium]
MQKFLFSSLLLTSISIPLQAQNVDTDTVALPEMVVTATRTETPRNQLSAASTVYSRADIERLQAKTVPELLRGTLGVDMVQTAGDGQLSSLFMRGTNSSHVLVLVDGIKVGSATLGQTTFEFIPIDQIERVEIIRGPQSSLYGSEAIGGVIQIFTRKGGDSDKPKFTLDAGGGNYNSMKGAGTVSGKWGDNWYTAGASHYNTTGFNSCQKDGSCFNGFGNEPDNDGYYNTAVNARVGHHFGDKADLEGSFMRSQGRTEYDGFFKRNKFINQVSALTGNMNIIDNWRTTLHLGQSIDINDYFLQSNALESSLETTRWNASWLNDIQITDDHQLVLGTDYRLDEVDSNTNYTKNSRYDVGVFGELHSRIFDDHYINASLRWDNNEAFGDYVTGSFGWRFNWQHGLSAFANFGNAFKSPTFNDLYFPTSTFFDSSTGTTFISKGNPNLRPEQSTTFEVGLSGDHDWLHWETRAYHTNIDNLIAFGTETLNSTTFVSLPKNINKAQIDGLEAEINARLWDWNSKLSLNLLDPIDRATHARLFRRYQKSMNFDLSRSFGAFDIGANVLAQGDRDDIDFSDFQVKKIGGYVTVGLRGAYHIDKNWMISAKLNNLLDKQYQQVHGFNQADRNFFVSIHYNN